MKSLAMFQISNVTQRFALAEIADSPVVKLQIAEENKRSAFLACPVGQVAHRVFFWFFYAGEKRSLSADANPATSKEPIIYLSDACAPRHTFASGFRWCGIAFELLCRTTA